ncbi:flagellar motility protein MotE (MotC chaperone) [Azospirillum lipoferum]|uniref:Flagellar motor switch protein n=1 Tax=Azospirillum lipoferum TaxID=193 RepID=A0A5A9GBL0_AZOLI|nr:MULTISPECIES: flagellar motor switch protein [Azospirillum]KAA0591860.1 flagellar motor switch protein [Azospirillum lipoferum]MCP1614652.1 flagellar motility protein MotE (MotC chaperone) [Azospirillum lipoferum]MDW5537512.1 flagellar motor switch protein [Azospirillum sp. NL1]
MIPRILPITLVAVLMVLPLKLGALVDGFPVIAQQFDREFGAHERPWATDLKATDPKAAEAAPSPPAPVPLPASPPVAEAPPPVVLAPPNCTDPLLRAAIGEQKADMSGRQNRLREAEAVLAATEARVGTQIQRLNGVKREVEALMTQRSTLAQEDLKRMVAIYEAMKPRDAARILTDMETDMVVDVLDRISERRAAPILAEMADAKAREVTRLILQRRALPGDRKAAPAVVGASVPVTTVPRPTLTN